jgi:small-conductance mechanosensitive channel
MDFRMPELSSFFNTVVAAVPSVAAIVAGAVILHYVSCKAISVIARRARFTQQEVTPIRRLTGWLIFVVALVLVFGALGFNVGGLWTALTTVFAMIAIGFVAVWSVLSNTLCTVIILISRPFAVGDEIEFPGESIKGRVENLNFIYTTLACEDGSVLQIPNNLFFQKTIRRRYSAAPVPLAYRMRAARSHPVDEVVSRFK